MTDNTHTWFTKDCPKCNSVLQLPNLTEVMFLQEHLLHSCLFKHDVKPCLFLVITTKTYYFKVSPSFTFCLLCLILFGLTQSLLATHVFLLQSSTLPQEMSLFFGDALSLWFRLTCMWLRWNSVAGPAHSLSKPSRSLQVRAGHGVEEEQKAAVRDD